MIWTSKFLLDVQNPDEVPFLHLLGCGGQSGFYAAKAKFNATSTTLALMIMHPNLLNSSDDYPHIIVNFDILNKRVMFDYHYSHSDSGFRIGKSEVKKINEAKSFTVSVLPQLVRQNPELILGIAKFLGSDILKGR